MFSCFFALFRLGLALGVVHAGAEGAEGGDFLFGEAGVGDGALPGGEAVEVGAGEVVHAFEEEAGGFVGGVVAVHADEGHEVELEADAVLFEAAVVAAAHVDVAFGVREEGVEAFEPDLVEGVFEGHRGAEVGGFDEEHVAVGAGDGVGREGAGGFGRARGRGRLIAGGSGCAGGRGGFGAGGFIRVGRWCGTYGFRMLIINRLGEVLER